MHPSKNINKAYHTFFDLKADTGVGEAFLAENYQDLQLMLATDGGGDANLTAKVQGSNQETEPDWTSAQSVTNLWDYIAVVDLNNSSNVLVGDTGFVVAGADDYRLFEVNTNRVRWINVIITARSAGELTAKLLAFPAE